MTGFAHAGRHRLAALPAEHTALDSLWREDRITGETHRLLDYEESLLNGQGGRKA